ncbi:MAG: hypothetical protein ACX93T_03780 [Bacteroidota bacterium]
MLAKGDKLIGLAKKVHKGTKVAQTAKVPPVAAVAKAAGVIQYAEAVLCAAYLKGIIACIDSLSASCLSWVKNWQCLGGYLLLKPESLGNRGSYK